ncbi:MAG: spore maturation protein [Prevotellaceae bacterium]|jgi:spore maturation protein SpmA|nr:spore maturation protein [Prevotellaceae bacterium]
MTLNYIWLAFFMIAFIVALVRLILFGDVETFNTTVNSTFVSAKNGFEISLGLTGVLALWMGLMKIGEQSGLIQLFSKAMNPLFGRLFPDIPKNHPASGSILLNISANLLGLDNAATPAGLQAMKELQEINPDKKKASNPMIMFLVLNASGMTLIPVSVMTIRAQMGASNPADVFIPILIATFVSTMLGVLAVCIKQKIRIFDKVILGTFGAIALLIALIIFTFNRMDAEQTQKISALVAGIVLFGIIIFILLSGVVKKINVYDAFIEGAKDGFMTAVRIIPYLIAILVAVGMFRASGSLDFLSGGLKSLVALLGFDTQWVDAIPTALMKPLSGSGARGMMVETMANFGSDSFAGRLAGVFQGSTDTTFYVVAVYYGSIAVKNSRYTIPYALLADLIGIVTAIGVAYLFFG